LILGLIIDNSLDDTVLLCPSSVGILLFQFMRQIDKWL